jgi:UPF0042 nucleotide-binding protein
MTVPILQKIIEDDLKEAQQHRVAVVLDVRTEPTLAALGDAIDHAHAAGWSVRFLHLDAKTETLVKRFSETRRRHRLAVLRGSGHGRR